MIGFPGATTRLARMSPDVAETEAIARALERLELNAGTPARAFLVRRIDPPGGAYYLVVLGAPSAALGIAVVDAASGEVTEWATLPGATPHSLLDREAAIQRTGASSARRAELVWRSSPVVPVTAVSVLGDRHRRPGRLRRSCWTSVVVARGGCARRLRELGWERYRHRGRRTATSRDEPPSARALTGWRTQRTLRT